MLPPGGYCIYKILSVGAQGTCDNAAMAENTATAKKTCSHQGPGGSMPSWLSLRCHTYAMYSQKLMFQIAPWCEHVFMIAAVFSQVRCVLEGSVLLSRHLVGACLLGCRSVLSHCCVVTRTLCTHGKYSINPVAPWWGQMFMVVSVLSQKVFHE